MTRVMVNRAMAAVAVTLIVLVVAFGWLVNRQPADPPSPPDGATLYTRACASCHRAEDIVRVLRDAPDPDTGRRRLLDLLRSHGETSDEEDAAIVRFLSGTASGR